MVAETESEGQAAQAGPAPEADPDRDGRGRFVAGNPSGQRWTRRRKPGKRRPEGEDAEAEAERRRLERELAKPGGLQRLGPRLIADAVLALRSGDLPASSVATLTSALLRLAVPEPEPAAPRDDSPALRDLVERAARLTEEQPWLYYVMRDVPDFDKAREVYLKHTGEAETAPKVAKEREGEAQSTEVGPEASLPPPSAVQRPAGAQAPAADSAAAAARAAAILRTQQPPELPPRPVGMASSPAMADWLREQAEAERAEAERRRENFGFDNPPPRRPGGDW